MLPLRHPAGGAELSPRRRLRRSRPHPLHLLGPGRRRLLRRGRLELNGLGPCRLQRFLFPQQDRHRRGGFWSGARTERGKAGLTESFECPIDYREEEGEMGGELKIIVPSCSPRRRFRHKRWFGRLTVTHRLPRSNRLGMAEERLDALFDGY